jgi:small subunit ribosomal protein S18
MTSQTLTILFNHFIMAIKKSDEAVDLQVVDYKDVETLKKFVTKFNKITPRYYSGISLKDQKRLAQAIKRARYMALMPYVLDLKQKAEVAI